MKAQGGETINGGGLSGEEKHKRKAKTQGRFPEEKKWGMKTTSGQKIRDEDWMDLSGVDSFS